MKKIMIAMAATLATTSAFAMTFAESEATVAGAYQMTATQGPAQEVVLRAHSEATVATARVMEATQGPAQEVVLRAHSEATVKGAAQW